MKETISSRLNALIIETAKLKLGKYRKASGMYLLEGTILVDEAIKCKREIIRLFVVQEMYEYYANRTNCDIIIISFDCLRKLCEAVSPQGVAAVLYIKDNNVKAAAGKALLLDGLQDAGNVGAIMRTAVAAGYKDIYLINNCVDVYSSKCIRSAMTAHFYLNIYCCSLSEVLANNKSYQLIIADMNGTDLYKCRTVSDKHILALGNEGNGISNEVSASADITVSLPMNCIESLNVSVCAGIIMYHLAYGK